MSIMSFQNPNVAEKNDGQETVASVEDIIERKLEDIATVLCGEANGKSTLYEEVVSMIERSLVRIALKRSNNVKSAAAIYLGISRNTFQNKMVKLGMTGDTIRQSEH
jgi:DNA-binding protein Fis